MTNLAYGSRKEISIILSSQYDVLTSLNAIMSFQDTQMLEQILWFLGNIAGEGEEFRNMIVKRTSLLQLFQTVIEMQKIGKNLLRTICWVNSNLARYKNNDDIVEVRPLL